MRNNSLSQDIFQKKTLFVSTCLYLYENDEGLAKATGKLLIYICNFKEFNKLLTQCPDNSTHARANFVMS